MISEWGIERDGATVSLLGPGYCEFHLFNFDASKVKTAAGDIEDAPTSKYYPMHFIFRSWVYPMSGETELCLYSQRNEADPESPWGHILEVRQGVAQWNISWTVPADFAEALYALSSPLFPVQPSW